MNGYEGIGDETPVPNLDTHGVHVWQISTAAPSPGLERLAGILSPDERDRAARFHFERDRRSFSVCRALLRKFLACYTRTDAVQIRFSYGPNGKPELEHPRLPELRFNVSHSGELALLAFALGRDVGVDVEFMRELDFAALAETSFSRAERVTVLARPPVSRARLFYRYWTCKEACIKADGRGLSVPLDGFSIETVAGEPHWRRATVQAPNALPEGMRVRVLGARPGYAAAIAAVGPDWDVRRIDLTAPSQSFGPAPA